MSKENRPFAERLRSERARLKLSQAQLAIVGGVSKTTQVGYESDAHVPDLEYVTLLEQSGVDKIFLLTGTTTSGFVASNFDWDLLGDIIQAILEWASEHKVLIPPHKFPDLVRLLYDESIETRTIEPAFVARALRLVA